MTGVGRLATIWIGLAVGVPATAIQPAAYDRPMGRVTAVPGTSAVRPVPPASGRKRCIGVEKVAGAVVFGDRAVELTMSNGTRWRMIFAQQCPALSFYQGFYYRRAVAGQLCAGRDAVIARSGGECQIASIIPINAPKTKPGRRKRTRR